MTDFVFRFTTDRQYKTFLALAECYPRTPLETISTAFVPQEVADAVRNAKNERERQQVKQLAKAAMPKETRDAIVDEIAAQGLEVSRNYMRQQGRGPKEFEMANATYINPMLLDGGTTVDEFGNTVPTKTALVGIFEYVRWNGDQPVQYLLDAVSTAGGTIYWRGDNADGPESTSAPLMPVDFPRMS